jgi:hypothetical protein
VRTSTTFFSRGLRGWFLKAILVLMCSPVYAQWVKVPPANVPRTSDGKPNLSAPAPRLADGRPDLSGIWQPNGKYVTNPNSSATKTTKTWNTCRASRGHARSPPFQQDMKCAGAAVRCPGVQNANTASN